MMRLEGKVALVTGGGRGIGKGCAVELARDGADIVLNDRPGSPDLESTANEIRALGRNCYPIEADVFTRDGCEHLVSSTLKMVPGIDILVSNPAFSRRARFLECPPELFEDTIRGTLTAGYHLSQLVARHMVQRDQGGKIIFISSVQAEMPIALCFAYGAAKAGLNHMMRSIAVELVSHRINVNAIEPGWIDTPGEHVTFSEETIAEEGAKLPWKRLGQPEEIGRAAVFLASQDAEYITGTVLPVDGMFRFAHCIREKTPQVMERPE
ncbi:MAG: SDR family oxidoreductase [Planctomycetaceae bacterium]|nr:SDR family oxidoreductase [Planctomycetaceae bacterium]